MLHIGFDAKRAFRNYTGLGNYSRSVITSLARIYPENHYSLYTPRQGSPENKELLCRYGNVRIIMPSFPFFRSLWRSKCILTGLKQDGIQIFHGLSHEIPLGISKARIKIVVTIHDLIFLRYPQYYKPIDRKIYTFKYKYACRHADVIVAISEQTKRDIVSFFHIPEEKIKVIYQTCAPSFRNDIAREDIQSITRRYHLPAQYLLCVGTVEKRKNLMVIAQALSDIEGDMPLVVVGKQTSYFREIKHFLTEKKLNERVIFLEDVPFSDLPAVYRQATLFLYPSEFEGFGIPLLEALYSGVPVIAAKGSCLEESGGPFSIYLDPHNSHAWSDTINGLLKDDSKRTEMIKQGKIFASRFTEEQQANELMSLYENLVP